MINKATLLGNVGNDPEIVTLESGNRKASFSLATSERWKDKHTGEKMERTEWHRIVTFNDGLIGVIEQYVKKGSQLYIEGQIKTRKWQDQSGNDRYSTEIVIPQFNGTLQLVGGKRDGATGAQSEDEYGQTKSRDRDVQDDPRMGMGATAGMNDEIPFAPEWRG